MSEEKLSELEKRMRDAEKDISGINVKVNFILAQTSILVVAIFTYIINTTQI